MNDLLTTLSRFPTGLSLTELSQRTHNPPGVVKPLLDSALQHGKVRGFRDRNRIRRYILNPAVDGEG